MNATLTRCQWCTKPMTDDGGYQMCDHCDNANKHSAAVCAHCKAANLRLQMLNEEIEAGE